MLERDGYPPGVPCWVDTVQPDPDEAIAFYGALLGWQFHERSLPGGSARYFVAQLRGRDVAGIGGQPEGAPPAPWWRTYIWVESADEAVAKARDAGGSVLQEPFDVSGAGRMAVLTDPSGAEFGVWEAREHRGAQLVNEPGTWNFSELNTPDPEGAKAFYGAVFDWKLSDFGPEAGGSGFWRVDGYGDFLAERDPDVRDRQADVGAPERFEDAVAWLVPITEEQVSDDNSAHWSITFAVADADDIADRTEKLGGKVLVPPRDEPWVRMTVIRDPQGAVFTASKFTPPS
jgi:uncharacterized protein